MSWWHESLRAELGLRLLQAVSFAGPIFLMAFSYSPTTKAQNQKAASVYPSELGRDNLSLVAASPAQIKTVLLQDPGLLVELKRWMAKDATDKGQIIVESDLTDDAIFDRIENDVPFRSIATRLVQQYGYLVPRLNPNSPQGKEQDLLLQERVKWLAQQEEEERTQEREKNRQDFQNALWCPPGAQNSCSVQQSAQPEQSRLPGSPQPSAPAQVPGGSPSQDNPAQPVLPIAPNTIMGPLQHANLTQGGNQSTGGLEMLGLSASNDAPRLFNGQNTSPADSDPLQRPDNDQNRALGFGSGVPSGSFDSGVLDHVGPNADLDTISPAHPTGSLMIPSQRFGGPVTPEQEFEKQLQEIIPPEPRMVRVRSPYNNIPSLYDMYLQANPRPSDRKRFGSEVFENGSRDPQLIPMDLPAGPDYVVGPGDGLAIDLWGGVSQRLYRTVDREGRVSLPEVGPLLVSGRSLADVQDELQRTLRTQFRDESAAVSLSRLRTIRVYEVGDVTNPGAYDISSLSTPLNALFAAGGPTPQGSLRIVKHYRGNLMLEEVDLYDLLLHGVRSGMARLENGDTVLVPPVGAQVTVEGMVRRPAIYELKGETTLSSVLELAGGLLPAASLRHVEVQRLLAHDKQTMLSIDVPEADSDTEITKQLDSFGIQDGDRIRVYPIAPYNQDAVYLEGHVLRPGRYSYKENMRVTDLVASFKELLPEPATQYAEIIRLNPPDFRPSVESFDIAEAIENPAAAPQLLPMDTVRIFSRFDFENPPSVSVWGDVRAPGTYQTSGQLHLSDAIHLAGGLAPDAKMEDAQVFRYLPDGKSKIFSVNLSAALSGDPTENIVLQSRDRLLIHRSADSLQPATVYVQGDVAKPGRYPLTTNMTVADLIRVGGGLKPSADTEAGDLTRYQWTGTTKLDGQQQPLRISAALNGDSNANISLRNGDVMTIRQLPGWNDLGASVSVKGEVKHPGTYGIRPGERLSSVLERTGGFQVGAYPYGAILQRTEVRELEAKQQNELILRVKDAERDLEMLPDTDPDKKKAKETAIAQYQTTLTELSANPPVGRVDIRISSNVKQWKNTPADIEVRAGDTLLVPKKPDFVMVTGQVFNPTAISYRPGKSAKWYLGQSGGPTTIANKKSIFVIRADGSVVGAEKSLWEGDALSGTLHPGDTVVVPEKAIGGGRNWTNLFTAAQVASSIASTAFIAAHY
jgi:protein involved in polysaccharide export with SLBB domain